MKKVSDSGADLESVTSLSGSMENSTKTKRAFNVDDLRETGFIKESDRLSVEGGPPTNLYLDTLMHDLDACLHLHIMMLYL